MIQNKGAFILLLLAWSAAPAAAQDGAIAGRVADETGAVLPGATITLRGPGEARVTASDGNGDYAFPALAPGDYSLTAALPGFSDAALDGIAVADGAVEAPLLTLSIASFGDTVVVTASRTEVRVVDAPVSTSVVPAATLETTASSNVGEVLRSVPGVNVIQLSARDVQVTSRQSTGTLANSQLVLVDGRSVYLDFFGMVLWDALPINQGDIEQIEVVRGPASATWGANAMTGAVNVITRTPRESVGTTVTMSGGWLDRDAGSTAGQGAGTMFGANATVTRAPSDSLAYRVSAGYFQSDAFPRPTGRVPVVADPRVPDGMVGGATYPLDGAGPFGAAFANRGTSQPKFDVRVDQELSNGGQFSYSGGVAGTEGLSHSGVGPFDIQRGSYFGYGKLGYTQGDFRFQFFTNVMDGDAPNLLLADPATLQPVQLGFKSRTFDAEVGHSTFVGDRNLLTYGGNVRRNTFDVTIAPAADDRLEFGAYLQDEIFFDRVRLVFGGRIDKFGNLSTPAFSPRLSVMFKPGADHSVTASYNRAFRSPSIINNFLDMNILRRVDLSGLAAFRPLLPALLPPGLPPAVAQGAVLQLEQQLDATTAQPFPLVVRAAGSDVPLGAAPRTGVTEESLTAWELSYTGSFGRGTTAGGAVYLNRRDDSINFVGLPATADPYTAEDPPPGWLLPPAALSFMATQGILLPRTAFTYVNLGPVRQPGAELWFDQRVSRAASVWFNYSWQGEPRILDDADNPFPPTELGLPPTHRVNVGASLNGSRFVGNASVSTATRAFWSDVLTPEFHGWSEGYTLVNGSFGVRWSGGAVTTLLKVTNLFNQDIQQHIFGDILRRTVVGEVRFSL